MDFEVVERINISKKAKKIGAFLYDPEIDGLYHESPWWFPVQIGVTHGLTKGQVTPMFLKLPFIMKGWVHEQILLRLIDVLRFASNGWILMHGSCVDDVLIVGLPNSGKTYQTYKSVAEGGTLISEEYTMIGPMKEAYPYKPVMRTCFSESAMKVAGLKKTFQETLWMGAATLRAKLFPFMYEAVIWREIPTSGQKSVSKNIIKTSCFSE